MGNSIIPFWYKVLASLESIFNLKNKKESLKMLEEAKNTINSPRELEDWYSKNKFKYFSDKIDSSSLPWVVISRRGGDCDDFMSLTYEILKSKFECNKILVYSTDGGAHAIVAVKDKYSESYTVMSNYERMINSECVLDSLNEAARYYYKEKTKRIIYLNS